MARQKMPGNMGNMMKQMQQMQKNMEKMQRELEEKTVDASSGGGAVSVTVSGKKNLVSIKIDPDVVDEDDIEMLEDLVLAAVNEGMNKAEEMIASEMRKATGGLNLPPGLM